MQEKKLDPLHLAAHDAVKEFTKFPDAGIQPELFQKARKALSDAFTKDEKAHNKSAQKGQPGQSVSEQPGKIEQ